MSDFADEMDGRDLDLYQIMCAAGQIEMILELTAHAEFDESKSGQMSVSFDTD